MKKVRLFSARFLLLPWYNAFMKKATSKKKENRIEKQLKTLETKDDFQKYIKDLRKNLGIPIMGFRSATEKENWFGKLDGENLIHSIDNDRKNYKNERADIEYKIQIERFLRDNEKYEFKDILEKFDLSDLYKDFIRGYVYYGDFFVYSIVRGQVKSDTKVSWFKLPDLRNKGKIRIFIEVYADTTSKDIQAVWDEIVEAKQHTIGYKSGHRKFQSSENLEIDKRMDELKKEGIKSQDINKIIIEEFGKILGYEYVLKRINRFRKRE